MPDSQKDFRDQVLYAGGDAEKQADRRRTKRIMTCGCLSVVLGLVAVSGPTIYREVRLLWALAAISSGEETGDPYCICREEAIAGSEMAMYVLVAKGIEREAALGNPDLYFHVLDERGGTVSVASLMRCAGGTGLPQGRTPAMTTYTELGKLEHSAKTTPAQRDFYARARKYMLQRFPEDISAGSQKEEDR